MDLVIARPEGLYGTVGDFYIDHWRPVDSRLTDEEMRKVDNIVRKTTVEKFGPVSSVTPSLVFELGIEGIALSKQHKRGIAVRFPRMRRWRQDKRVGDAGGLATLQDLLG